MCVASLAAVANARVVVLSPAGAVVIVVLPPVRVVIMVLPLVGVVIVVKFVHCSCWSLAILLRRHLWGLGVQSVFLSAIVLHCERSAGEVETDKLCEILVEGEELLQL